MHNINQATSKACCAELQGNWIQSNSINRIFTHYNTTLRHHATATVNQRGWIMNMNQVEWMNQCCESKSDIDTCFNTPFGCKSKRSRTKSKCAQWGLVIQQMIHFKQCYSNEPKVLFLGVSKYAHRNALDFAQCRDSNALFDYTRLTPASNCRFSDPNYSFYKLKILNFIIVTSITKQRTLCTCNSSSSVP